MTIVAWNFTNSEFTLAYKHPLYKSKYSLGVWLSAIPTFLIVFFLVCNRDPLGWSHSLWIVVGKKLGDLCVMARSWGQEKRTTSREHLEGEAGRGEEETECAKANYAYLNIPLEFALCSVTEKNLSSSSISHLQSYYWLHGPMPARIQKLSCTLTVIHLPSLWVH